MFIEKMTDKEVEELIQEMQEELKQEKIKVQISVNDDVTMSDFKIFFNNKQLTKQEKFVVNKVFRRCMKRKFGQKYASAIKDYKMYKQNKFEDDLCK